MQIRFSSALLVVVVVGCLASGRAMADPLPSWNESSSRPAIVDFVEAVSDPTGDHFVPVADRIAVFDNDGTLWAEQPVYFQ